MDEAPRTVNEDTHVGEACVDFGVPSEVEGVSGGAGSWSCNIYVVWKNET